MRSSTVARKLVVVAALVAGMVLPGRTQRTGSPPPRSVPPTTVSPFEQNVGPTYAKQDTRTLKFSSSVYVILVPAVVTDKSGAHVSGLTAGDFTVMEGGKEQKIASCEEVKAEASHPDRPAAQPNQFTNMTVSGQAPKHLTILALDTANTAILDQTRSREALINYLAHTVDAGQPTMLVNLNGNGVQVIHDFTTDPAILVAALHKVHSKLPQLSAADTQTADTEPVDPQVMATAAMNAEVDQLLSFMESRDQSAGFRRGAAVGSTLESLQYLAQALEGVPGRKSLIWVTGGFPFNIDSGSANLLGGDSPSLLYERTFQMLNNANIAVYPVDARGLVALGLPDASVKSTTASFIQPTTYIGNISQMHSDTIGTLEMVASMTGGRAFYNRNDLEHAFREASDDSASYYMLTYHLDKTNTKPGWRKLAVKVHRDGVHVRARTGFFLDRTLMEPQETRQMDVAVALQSPLQYSALPVTVRIAGMEEHGGKRKVKFEIVLAANSATIDDNDGNRVSLDFAAVARDGKGDGKGVFSQTFSGKLKPENVQDIRENGITYTNSLDLAPGEYSVHIVVRDNLNGRMGSVVAPVKVM